MTCVIATVQAGLVWMGGDAVVSTEDAQTTSKSPKVIVTDAGWVVGFSGYWETWRQIRCADWPEVPEADDEVEAVVLAPIADMLRDWRAEIGKDCEFSLLIGARGRLWEIDSEALSIRESNGTSAIGCGAPYALGAMHALAKVRKSPRSRIIAALEAAAAHSVVRPPWTVVKG